MFVACAGVNIWHIKSWYVCADPIENIAEEEMESFKKMKTRNLQQQQGWRKDTQPDDKNLYLLYSKGWPRDSQLHC